ncbi:MAG: pyridoxamine 5'-phosphate oxidase family protein [Candidatus Competibacteraceae bacterium]|nr:pyridoxamine 5'-phosphate oxidase family protein [Candidatus Competibacteraceae bacterium]
MNLQERHLLVDLIRNQRWAALATQGPDGPEASWVAYAAEAGFSGFLLHLSTLASHTRNLLAHPRAGLAISAPEQAEIDPQTLARVTIQGDVGIIPKNSEYYQDAVRHYQARLPGSLPRFEFTDFLLLRLTPIKARFVGGFARAYTLDAAALRATAQAID